jgi:uncharacterized protein YkwD
VALDEKRVLTNVQTEGTTMKKLTTSLLLITSLVGFSGTVNAVPMEQTAPRELKSEREYCWLTNHPSIQKLHTLINEERKLHGLEPLVLDPKMCLKAQEHAVWMAETGYYQHSSFPWPEIIFYGPRNAESAVQGWIYSPAHHGIMLGGGTQCGYGYMVIDGRCYWVGVFH